MNKMFVGTVALVALAFGFGGYKLGQPKPVPPKAPLNLEKTMAEFSMGELKRYESIIAALDSGCLSTAIAEAESGLNEKHVQLETYRSQLSTQPTDGKQSRQEFDTYLELASPGVTKILDSLPEVDSTVEIPACNPVVE